MVRIFLLVTIALFPACSIYHKELDQNPPFSSHRFRAYDVEITWQAERTTGGIRLAGTVTNRRSYYLHDLELTARLVDHQGKVVDRETYGGFPTYISPGKTEAFQLELHPTTGGLPQQIRFTYVYWLAEESPAFRGYGDVPTFGSFNSPL